MRFNRTFMELKLYMWRIWRGLTFSFNRTFMELKSMDGCWLSDRADVLIVPLWNWNVPPKARNRACFWGFNRTFMELKLTDFSVNSYVFICFNRTFMELKWQNLLYCFAFPQVLIVPLWNWNLMIAEKVIVAAAGFNRTFMELK